tara:strand:- start:249 stop:674 length:426 start_codon:yes stop_codon:yes gene_type:complete
MIYKIKTKIINNIEYIFDYTRKKYIQNSPEEWVRQNFILYLYKKKGYPINLMSTEKKTKINGINFRTDIVCYNKIGKPILLIECKSQNIKINIKTFDQLINYQSSLNANYMVITNGNKTICFNIKNNKINLIKKIPLYSDV